MLAKHFNLAAQALMVLLPIAVTAVLTIHLQNQREIDVIERSLANEAVSMAAAIDRHLVNQVNALQSMATVEPIETSNLAYLRGTMSRMQATHGDWLSVALSSQSSIVVSTLSKDPSPIPNDWYGINTVFETARPHISGVYPPNSQFQEPYYIVQVPIMREDKVRYVLGAVIPTWSAHETLATMPASNGGRIEILDQNDNILALSNSHSRLDPLIGRKPSDSLIRGASRAGTSFYAIPQAGLPVYGIAAKHEASGWRMVVTAPQMELDAPRMQMLLVTIGGTAIALVLASYVGLMLIGTMDGRAVAERRLISLEARAQQLIVTERLQVAFEAGRIGAFERDIVSDLLTADQRTRAIFGFSDVEPIDLPRVRGMVHPDDLDAFDATFHAARRGERNDGYALEFRIIHSDGSEHWVDVRGRAIFDLLDGKRRPVRFIGACVDVTESRAAAHAMRESEQRLRLGAQVAGFGTFEMNPLTNELSWSPEMYEIFGIEPGTPIDFPMAFAMTHPDDIDELKAQRDEYLHPDGPGESSIVHRIVRTDGEVRWIDKRVRTIRGSAPGRRGALRVIGAVQDITERRRAMDALAEANAELERRVAERTEQLVQTQKMEAIGQLTAGVAHDFNNVLQGVSSCFAAMERRIVDAQSRKLFDAAQDGIQRGARLTQHLLAFARRQTLSPKPTRMTDMLEAMRPILERSMGGLIRIGIEVVDGTWPAQVDPTQIEVAVLNLAINARDAMPLGGMLALKAHNATISDPRTPAIPVGIEAGEYVVVSVSDTGTGMDATTLAHVFEPFFTTKEVGKGSGLGLSMVHGMAAQSGGGVHIHSTPGEGTTVSIFLPRASEVTPAIPLAEATTAGPVDGTILLVDDDELVRFGATAVLEEAGYTVLSADGGPAALRIIKEGVAIDALLTDYAMPGMSGAVLIAEAHALCPGLPALLMTGYVERPSDAEGIALLKKPFKPNDLLRHLDALIVRAPPKNVIHIAASHG